jgi:hypothetical protein
VNRVAVKTVNRSEISPIMTLKSRQPRVESGVQIITVNDSITSPDMTLIARHVSIETRSEKGFVLKKVTEYDAQIPSAKNRLSSKTVNRESL